MSFSILYIVRGFGNFGGMETYVHQTAVEMRRMGHRVYCLCAGSEKPPADIPLFLANLPQTQRSWQSRWIFRSEVTRMLPELQAKHGFDIIHSHDNTLEHTICTQHGPCMASAVRKKPWKLLDPSARRNLRLEREKFHAPNLRAVIGCSERVCAIVRQAYPHLPAPTVRAIPPAFSYAHSKAAERQTRPRKVLGYIGYDWERKGLPRVLSIFRNMRRNDPQWSLEIGGVEKAALPWWLRRHIPQGVRFHGRTDAQAFYDRISVLIHPARDEPFGMVIPEALSSGVPVLASSQCGACAHICCEALRMLPLAASNAAWTTACVELENKPVSGAPERNWSDVARDHQQLYEEILCAM